MNGRSSLTKEGHNPLISSAEIGVEDTSVPRNSYVPSVLPNWEDWCSHKAKIDRVSISLDLDVPTYAGSVSRVGWKGRVGHALKQIEKYSEFNESLLAYLLECVITTVIGLASDQVLPEEYLHCSFLYLQNIKDEFGESPSNIATFMKLITSKLSKVHAIFEKLDEENLVSSKIVITRLPKSVQKRLRK